MNRAQIEKWVTDLSRDAGYTPQITSSARLESQIEKMPTAWISPLKLLGVSGVKEGVMEHQLNITLLDDYIGRSVGSICERVAQMESDMLDILARLSRCDGVVEINSATITPKIDSTTKHGTIEQVCRAKIVTYFSIK